MWGYEHSLETDASAQAIFALYENVSGWPDWDSGLESADLDGPFVAGATGSMVVAGQGRFDFRLLSVEAGWGFEDETELPGTGLVVRFSHVLEPLAGGLTRVTHGVTIHGPAAAIMGPQIGPGITADTPEAMAALVARAATQPARP
jgi:hypothetical protein